MELNNTAATMYSKKYREVTFVNQLYVSNNHSVHLRGRHLLYLSLGGGSYPFTIKLLIRLIVSLRLCFENKSIPPKENTIKYTGISIAAIHIIVMENNIRITNRMNVPTAITILENFVINVAVSVLASCIMVYAANIKANPIKALLALSLKFWLIASCNN